MKEILQLSDFALKVSFIDIKGDIGRLTKFKFSYSTTLSNPVVAEFDGTNYSPNCRAVADGIEVLFDTPRFNVGQIKVRREYTIQSAQFPDGTKDYTEVNLLPLEIVQSYSKSTPQNGIIPLTNASSSDVVWVETVIVESIKGETGDKGDKGDKGEKGDTSEKGDKGDQGDKGDKGDKGDAGGGIDRSITSEQLLNGHFWVGIDGSRKQLYGRRINVNMTVVDRNGVAVAINNNLQVMEKLCSIEGCFEGEDSSGAFQNSFPGLGLGVGILRRLNPNLPPSLTISFSGLDRSSIGKPFKVDLFVTYTKP